MITSAKYVNYIVETLNVLRQEIISKSAMGLTDDNKHLESFIAFICNKTYGWNLENLNEEKANFPGVDVGDRRAGLAMQITATKTSEKVNDTISKVSDDRHGVYAIYNKLKFFILSSKQNSYSVNSSDKIDFDWKSDILDFDDVYKSSMYLPLTDQRELAEYIHQQIPYVTKELGIDYYNLVPFKRLEVRMEDSGWKRYESGCEFVIEHNFGYTPTVSVIDEKGSEVMGGIRKNEKTVIVETGPWKDGQFFNGTAILT